MMTTGTHKKALGRLAVLAASVAVLTGCYAKYVPPAGNSDFATLRLTNVVRATVAYRIWENPSCEPSEGYGTIKGFLRDLPQQSEHRIPAGKPIYLHVSITNQGRYGDGRCESLQRFTPLPNGLYKASVLVRLPKCEARVDRLAPSPTATAAGYAVIESSRACLPKR